METRPAGTQCLDRAVRLMKLLATRDKFGWGLTDLSRRSGIDKATVHRILSCFETHRLVHRNATEHRYFPGPMLLELGLSVSNYHPFLEHGRQALGRLVERTGAVALLYLRSGSDSVVAGKVETSVHRAMLNDVGCRRPLLMSAGGVAMLCALPQQERDAIELNNISELASMGIPRLERFQNVYHRALELGFAANLEDVVTGINSFAVCVRDRQGQPVGSLALAGDIDTLRSNLTGRWAAMLHGEATALTEHACSRAVQNVDRVVAAPDVAA